MCPHCQQIMPAPSLLAQVTAQIRKHIRKYYEGRMICDEPSCQNKTRQMSVNGRQCTARPCRGTLHKEVISLSRINEWIIDIVIEFTFIVFWWVVVYSDSVLYEPVWCWSLLEATRKIRRERYDATTLVIWTYISPEIFKTMVCGCKDILDSARAAVRVYLNYNARGFVDLKQLFSFSCFNATNLDIPELAIR